MMVHQPPRVVGGQVWVFFGVFRGACELQFFSALYRHNNATETTAFACCCLHNHIHTTMRIIIIIIIIIKTCLSPFSEQQTLQHLMPLHPNLRV